MREIKFRGKRLDNGQWVYGSLLQSEIDVNQLSVKCEVHERFADDFSIKKYAVDPKTVGQWAGLKDKNGKEIYEGDIVTCKTKKGYHDIQWPHKGIVEYIGSCFTINVGRNIIDLDIDTYTPFYCNEDFEIIGNIHNNPELLNN